ncbi:Alpha-ketoglutarate-dependent dioxygenase alkB 7, mitochondrial [Entophlyctis sp. JEL0112]|nr:Alpha-ketoglutarate-dependent dioxygenase alkB 7, mitochondrial [Entophlyctis sp. JEL0112]
MKPPHVPLPSFHARCRNPLVDTSRLAGLAAAGLPAPSPADLGIVPAFLPARVHDFLDAAVSRKLRRLARGPYLDAHFDGVISGYKEASVSAWAVSSSAIQHGPGQHPAGLAETALAAVTSLNLAAATESEVDNVARLTMRWIEAAAVNLMVQASEESSPSSNTAQLQAMNWLPPHILELRDPADGKSGIGAHVDHLTAFGSTIVGVCLSSDAVMQFTHKDYPSIGFSVLLPRGCLYYQRDSVRYNYSHEIPFDDANHVFKGKHIPRSRRVSIMTGILRKLREQEAKGKARPQKLKQQPQEQRLYDSEDDEDDHESDADGDGNDDLQDNDPIFSALLITIPLTILHCALTYVVHVQYAFAHLFDTTHVLSHVPPTFAAVFVLVYTTSKFRQSRLMQAVFAVTAAACGVYVVRVGDADRHPSFAELLNTAGVAIMWIYAVAQSRLGFSLCGVGVPLVYYAIQAQKKRQDALFGNRMGGL